MRRARQVVSARCRLRLVAKLVAGTTCNLLEFHAHVILRPQRVRPAPLGTARNLYDLSVEMRLRLMSIEQNYNIRFIASLALREKQIQQTYRPIIAVHKWFARRPGTLFRGLLLSERVPAIFAANSASPPAAGWCAMPCAAT